MLLVHTTYNLSLGNFFFLVGFKSQFQSYYVACYAVFGSLIHCFFCSFAYSHRNLFGRNQKFHVSLERGQIDSIFRINYTDPWIAGDDKRTSRTIMVQVIRIFCPLTTITILSPLVNERLNF